jgi:uncharacterized membrane protein
MKLPRKEEAMMGYGDIGWSGGWWVVMWVSMVLFWTFIVVLAAWLFSSLRGPDARDRESPENTLARRLASGDIDEATYRRLRDEIRTHHGPLSPAP